MQYTVILNQKLQDYIKNLELVKVILKLLSIYYDAEALIPIFEECVIPLLHKFISTFRKGCC